MPDYMVTDPKRLAFLTGNIPGVYVLPWYEDKIYSVDWSSSSETLTNNVNLINQDVISVETNDPWVEATFGVKGTGEGLVFYPESSEHHGYKNFANLVFKAKGEAHKNIKKSMPAQIDPLTVASKEEFIDMVLTIARLEQGATSVAGGTLIYDVKLTGKFVAWISGDVDKEAQDELAASGLTWKEIQKPLAEKTRSWYLEQVKKL